MSDNLPDITQSSAWQALAEHHRELTPDLRGWFAEDPERAELQGQRPAVIRGGELRQDRDEEK